MKESDQISMYFRDHTQKISDSDFKLMYAVTMTMGGWPSYFNISHQGRKFSSTHPGIEEVPKVWLFAR